MKRLFFVFIISIVIVGCENTQVYDPALQAQLDNELFRSLDAQAKENEDGTYVIQGITQHETLTLKIATLQVGEYQLGGTSPNFASFENFNGDTYYTNPNGEGKVTISSYDPAARIVSGTFNFVAIIEGVDTIAVNSGVFFEAPIRVPELEIDDDDEPNTNAGTFVSYINDNPFNPFSVSAERVSNAIVIKGSTTNREIVIRLPLDVAAGNISLPHNGYFASYEDGDGTETAVSGNIIVFEHLPASNKVKGTFSFQTATKSISLGQFNVFYE
ncbi:DUF6252 family protein [Ulvibacter antarcticus]|uniref:Uncharacterized protein n=1 Tax=Ulvibacter antarcticus TaxID=442714 RepID=A0A3L9Z1H0_9FLAO|nr:DUF6252 family protein [Ulvibacter antarcticus]RMA66374.1 hypothetical protein BXY75_0796 [Ulvibacter antarcticus]